MAAEPAGLVSFEQARHIVEDHASRLRPRGRELLGLLDANGRVLAEPVHADRDFPPFPRAARDGYAVRAADLEKLPATLEVIGEIKAGATPAQIRSATPTVIRWQHRSRWLEARRCCCPSRQMNRAGCANCSTRDWKQACC